MNTLNTIIEIIVGLLGLFSVCFVIVIFEDAIEGRNYEKRRKEDAEKRKGQYETANLGIDPEKNEKEKYFTTQNIPENCNECNLKDKLKDEAINAWI